jgi:quercetin dioxygenase-like cupin family protein
MMASLIEDPVLKQRLEFEPSEDGQDVTVKVWVEPGGGVPPHVHPSMEERFTVLSGQPSFLAGRKWQTAAPGHTVVVPAGVRHAYRNRGDEVAHVVCQASPAMSLQDFLEEAAAMARAGKITRHGLPKSPSAFVQALRLALRHRKMVVMRPV